MYLFMFTNTEQVKLDDEKINITPKESLIEIEIENSINKANPEKSMKLDYQDPTNTSLENHVNPNLQTNRLNTRKKRGRPADENKRLKEHDKSIMKNRMKKKFTYSIKITKNLLNGEIPTFLVNMIRNKKFELINMKLDNCQQKAIINIGKKLTKDEIAIMLLMVPENEEEIFFLKNTILTEQFFDILFRNIDNKLIE